MVLIFTTEAVDKRENFTRLSPSWELFIILARHGERPPRKEILQKEAQKLLDGYGKKLSRRHGLL